MIFIISRIQAVRGIKGSRALPPVDKLEDSSLCSEGINMTTRNYILSTLCSNRNNLARYGIREVGFFALMQEMNSRSGVNYTFQDLIREEEEQWNVMVSGLDYPVFA